MMHMKISRSCTKQCRQNVSHLQSCHVFLPSYSAFQVRRGGSSSSAAGGSAELTAGSALRSKQRRNRYERKACQSIYPLYDLALVGALFPANSFLNYYPHHSGYHASFVPFSCQVFLKYLPPHCNEDEVSNFFSGCGEMAPGSPKLMRAPDGRVIRGFVVFTTPEGCMQVCVRGFPWSFLITSQFILAQDLSSSHFILLLSQLKHHSNLFI